VTRPRGILPRPVRERYHRARQERLAAQANGATKEEVCATGTAEGDRYRHLLLWVTSLPPGGGPVKVAEVRLRV
jgi:hypothetical protein